MPDFEPSNRQARRIRNTLFQALAMTSAGVALLVLATLLLSICLRGVPRLSLDFITTPMSSDAHHTGIAPALIGSISILAICAISAIPLGVATAILLEEYRPKVKWVKVLHGFVQNNITNLAGVPSIVYGILGFSVFVVMFSNSGLKDPWLDIGQDFYLEYPGAGGQSYYVKSYEDAPLTPASAAMDVPIYGSIADAKSGAQPVTVQIVEAGELEAIRLTVEDRLYEINATMKQALRQGTVDGVFQTDEAQAAVLAGEMLTPFRGDLKADYEQMKSIAAQELLAMSGMGPIEQIVPRRVLRQKLIDAEFEAAGLRGLIIEGTAPLAKDEKRWYYLQIPFGKGVLAGGLTLMLVILPVIIVSAQESIRAVSQEMRAGVLALGGTKWQAIEKVVIPSAVPGICTGAILAMSRAIGEAAPILLIGYVGVQAGPDNLMAAFAALPLEIYTWTSEPELEFRNAAAAGIIVLLAVLFSFNAVAVLIRQKIQRSD